MRSFKLRAFTAAVATALLLTVLFGMGAGAATQSPAEAEKELDQLLKEINETKTTVNKYKTEEKNALKALQTVENDLANTKYRISKAEKDMVYLQNRLAAVQKELVVADSEFDAAKAGYAKTAKSLEEKIVAIYKAGNPQYMEMLFSSKSFAEFMSRSDYLKAMVRYDEDALKSLKQKQEEMADKAAAAEKKKAELEKTQKGIAALKLQLEADMESLTSKYEARERYLSQVQKEKIKWEKELAEEEKQSRELESLIRDKQDSRTTSEPSKLKGRMIWPVDGGWVSSEYGWRISPIFGDRRFHAGIDIAVPTGTPVKAAADGKVLESRWINGYGYTVILDHGGGISTLYGHNSKLLLKPGTAVKQGTVISKAGSTGWSTGPHVHFEVRENGVAKEPRNYLVRK